MPEAASVRIRRFTQDDVAFGMQLKTLAGWNQLPEDWERFKSYCKQDVRTERDIRHKLEALPLKHSEWEFYHMDQRINDRGVLIDRTLVEQAITCDLMLSEEMTKKAYELTGLENPNSVSQLKGWLEERGIAIDSLGKKDVAAMIKEIDKNGLDQDFYFGKLIVNVLCYFNAI